MNQWICCQLGAREHYAIPRALHSQGQLKCLITDAWVTEISAFNYLLLGWLSGLRQRYHSELKTANVIADNSSLLLWTAKQKYQSDYDWYKIIKCNHWWQKRTLKHLESLKITKKDITLFTYSYAALDLLKYAKQKGWKTVLGQIDPGIVEAKLVLEASKKYPQYQSKLSTIPLDYWQNWRAECNLADRIIVNSRWSAQALTQTGISLDKIEIIPLAYQPPAAASEFIRTYPQSFDRNRPLKVLFLGQVIMRKGIAAIFEAIKLLSARPIEFWFVGAIGVTLAPELKHHPQLKLCGAVNRQAVQEYYQQADIFLFPTLSDGFGLTQLEAQAWGLPIIASEFCGSVVKDKLNGLILPNVSPEAIVNSLSFCLHNPHLLQQFSQASNQVLSEFNLTKLAGNLSILDSKIFKLVGN